MRISSLIWIFVLAAGNASAATLHSISTRASCGTNTDSTTEVLQTTALTAGASVGPPANSEANCSAGANAFVGAGTIRTSASVINPGSDDSPVLIRGSAGASGSLRYSFRFIATKLDPDPLTVSVNMNATGTAFASSNKLISDSGAFLNSGQTISSLIRAFGTLSSGGQSTSFEETASVRANPGQTLSESLPGSFTTGTISVQPGALVSFSFGLDTGTGGQLFGASATGRVSANRSLSFATDRPVFNVPEGYLIEIDEPRIVNNRYFNPEMTLPGDGIDPAPVIPLPAAGWALLSGMLALLTLKRRQKVAWLADQTRDAVASG